jgi:hypothetical protein
MTRSATFLCSLLLAGALGAGCGDSSATSTIDCEASCTKTAPCDPTQVQSECVSVCQSMNAALTDDTLTRLSQCLELTCDALQPCTNQVMQSCTGDASAFTDAQCAKQIECGGSGTLDQCRALTGANDAPMKCLRPEVLGTLTTCVQTAACATLNADLSACAQQAGILISG